MKKLFNYDSCTWGKYTGTLWPSFWWFTATLSSLSYSTLSSTTAWYCWWELMIGKFGLASSPYIALCTLPWPESWTKLFDLERIVYEKLDIVIKFPLLFCIALNWRYKFYRVKIVLVYLLELLVNSDKSFRVDGLWFLFVGWFVHSGEKYQHKHHQACNTRS